MSSKPPKPSKPSKSSKSSKSSRRSKKGGAKRSPTGSPKGQAREFSAGGVVVRDGQVATIVPTRLSADGSKVLALPKGHVDPGETPIEAAVREVREETGLVAKPVVELGESRYWYRRDGQTIGKTVSFFLFKYVEGSTADHDDEVEEVRWMSLKDAQTALSHTAEREMVKLAIAHLRKDR